MLDPSTLAMPFFATLALVLAPGPAVLYIVGRSIDGGRTAGFASAAGIATGGLVHVAGAALGLSAIIASSAVAFSALKYLGAAYLIFLGVRTLLSKPDGAAMAGRSPQTLRGLYSQGFVVQALNPKVALFFLAFLPQFIDPARGDTLTQTLILGMMFIALGFCTDSMYAFAAGTAGDWLKRQPLFASFQRYLAGTIFIGLGVTTAFSGAKSR
jgi:threonine/homoserine/homoserine lactone efflux protein